MILKDCWSHQWYLFGNTFAICEVKEVQGNQVTLVTPENQLQTIPLESQRFVSFSDFQDMESESLTSLRTDFILYRDISSDSPRIPAIMEGLYLKTQIMRPNLQGEEYILVASRPRWVTINFQEEFASPTVPSNLLKCLQLDRGHKCMSWNGLMSKTVYQDLLRLSQDSSWQDTIRKLYEESQKFYFYKNDFSFSWASILSTLAQNVYERGYIQNHYLPREEYREYYQTKPILGWAKKNTILKGGSHIKEHVSKNICFLQAPFFPMEADRIDSENQTEAPVRKYTAKIYGPQIQIPSSWSHKLSYNPEGFLVWTGTMSGEEYSQALELCTQSAAMQQAWKAVIDNLSTQYQLDMDTVISQCVLKKPLIDKSILVYVYGTPNLSTNPVNALNVLHHFAIYSTIQVDNITWYLLGRREKFLKEKRILEGYVTKESIITWNTAQVLAFSAETRKRRILRQGNQILGLAKVYENLDAIKRAALGLAPQKGDIVSEEIDVDIDIDHAYMKHLILSSHKVPAQDGTEARVYKISYIANNMLPSIQYEKMMETVLQRLEELATIDIVFVMLGSSDAYPYADQIKERIQEIFKKLQEAQTLLKEKLNPDRIEDLVLKNLLERYKIVPTIRVALLVYRDACDKEAECNFYNFKSTARDFQLDFSEIRFGNFLQEGNQGDQASHIKALKSLLHGKFEYSDRSLGNKSTQLSWRANSTKMVFLLGKVGQERTLDSWNEDDFIREWKALDRARRFYFFTMQYGNRNSEGHRRFKSFCDAVNAGINRDFAEYVHLSNPQDVTDRVKEFFEKISQSITTAYEAMYEKARTGGLAATIQKYGSSVLQMSQEVFEQLVAPRVIWHQEVPAIPKDLKPHFYYNSEQRMLILKQKLSAQQKEQLKSLSLNPQWWAAIETLFREGMQQDIDLNHETGLYKEGYVFDRQMIPTNPGYQEYQVDFSVYMSLSNFGEIRSVINRFIELGKNILGRQLPPDIWHRELKEALRSLYEDPQRPMVPRRKSFVLNPRGKTLLGMSLDEVSHLNDEEFGKLLNSAIKKLEEIIKYQNNLQNWSNPDIQEMLRNAQLQGNTVAQQDITQIAQARETYSYVPLNIFDIECY